MWWSLTIPSFNNEAFPHSFLSLFLPADKDMGHPSRRVITKPLDPVVHQQEEEYNNEGIISVYCAILGAIVLGK